ncbi:11-beta-hydroxysteroid dehydrogenase-like 2 [Actinidia eriantha]|uniref:11-beta-hydroxysteroid dehydrogenase-like 2 n=1 Tax=Actinidia eriantha TaxID=165200 RepID=UPI00258F4BBE|nr:11-beta-hydroxysteroid dehydrogenase-like 2 [Actinidia eriantha]
MDVNFWGSIYPTYFAIPHLKRTKGIIVVNSRELHLSTLQQQASIMQAKQDDVIHSFPVMSTEPCGKAIVEGACRGKRYVTELQCFRWYPHSASFTPN